MRLFATLLSFWVASSLDAALNDCADEFDSTALMQTRLAALARDRNPDSDATWETKLIRDASFGQTQAHANTSGDIIEATVREMTATVDDIERKARQAPTGSWDENQATLADFRTTIQQQLQVFLESESSQDQEEFNTRKQQHVACNADQRWQPGGDVANAAAEVARWRTKHQACRASQRAWLTYKTTAIASSSCASAADIPTEHEVYAEHVTLAALVTAAQNQASTYDLTDPAGKRACDLDQTQFEDHYCTWRSAHYYACASAQDCASQTGLSALADALRTRAENRRNLARTLEILSCRVGHLLSSMDNDATTEVSDFNTTDNCSNIGVNQSLFVLDLTIPSLPACNDHLAPGTTTSILGGPSLVDAAVCQAFRDANYVASQGFEVASHVIPTQCQATCPAISYIPWVLPPVCVNEPEDCTFYNHHRDACGSYDTATFVAGDSCCACGGGALTTTTTTTPTYSNAPLAADLISTTTPTGWGKAASEINYGQSGLVGHYWHALDVVFRFQTEMAFTGVEMDYTGGPNGNTYVAYTSMDGNAWTEVGSSAVGSQTFATPSIGQYARLVWVETDGTNGIHARWLGEAVSR